MRSIRWFSWPTALLLPSLALATNPPTTITLKKPAAAAIVPVRPDTFSWHDAQPRPTIPGSSPARLAPYQLQVTKDATFPTVTPTVFPIPPSYPYAINSFVNDSVLAAGPMVFVLDPNALYYWRVFIPTDSGGDGSFAQGSFTTGDQPPEIPVLESPSINAQDIFQGQKFVWHKSDRAVNYRLQIAFDNGFTVGVQDTLVSDTTGSFPSLAYHQVYYWRVRGENTGGPGIWSLVRGLVTTIAPPAKPVMIYPADNAVNASLPGGFSWNQLPVDGWHLQVATDTGFTNLVYVDSTSLVGNAVGATATGLDSGLTYYCRLRGKNSGGVSPWSDWRRFTTYGHVPLRIAPVTGANDVPLRPTFKWSRVPQAASYGLIIAEVRFEGYVQYHDTVINIQSGITDTAYQSDPLPAGHVFVWYAGAAISQQTSFSDYGIFTNVPPLPGPPILKTPAQDSQNVEASYGYFQWDSAPIDPAHGTSAGYRFQLSAENAFAAPLLDSILPFSGLLLTGRLSPGTRYYWRVLATNGNGPGDWSVPSGFTTTPNAPAAPALVSPASNSDSESLTPTLRWRASTGATQYIVALESFVDTDFVELRKDTLTDTSVTVGPLNCDQYYSWSVVALNAGGKGYSVFRGFRTLPDLPGKVVLMKPANGSQNVSIAPTLVWDTVRDAYDFRLVASASADFGSPVIDTLISPEDSNVFAIKGLANDTKYHWRVRSENLAGPGAWSDPFEFTTIVRLPDPVTLVFPAQGETVTGDSTRALWRVGVPNADRYWVAVSKDSAFSGQFIDTAVTDTGKEVRYSAAPGTYWWKVKAHNVAGWGEFSPKQSFIVADPGIGILPKDFKSQFVEFTGGSQLRYGLLKPGHVTIRMFDFRGSLRAVPMDGDQPAGQHDLILPALPRGVYYLSFRAGDFRRQARVLLDR
ncbi:MAG: hypothetical protein JWO30_847 [Fibrobacteres bacterium]|nr:hypothetical protein [Fibrobacterota bacterium]